jgi:hypothetical protein
VSKHARIGLAALAAAFLVAHLPFLPPTLEDLDSINFALGVRVFDVAHHQPHPPGYPIFIAFAKLSTSALRVLGVPAPASRGLALCSVLSGVVAILALWAFIRALDGSERRAGWTTLVVVTSPLFWFTAVRPLSDMMGFCVALIAQALVTAVIVGRGSPAMLAWGAFAAGLAVGVRAQTFLLTAPLLGVALLLPGIQIRVRDRLVAAAAILCGVLAWGVPLIAASGGLSSYLAALGSQAGEDFSGVVMLWNVWAARAPGLKRVAADALLYSFVWPWGRLAIGGIVCVAGGLGFLRLAWKTPRMALVLLIAFVPYAVFHLLFHEVVTVRYALPLVVPIAYPAVYLLDGLGRVARSAGVVALAAVFLTLSIPATAVYGRVGSPTFQALGRIAQETDRRVEAVGLHAVARRAVQWEDGALQGRVLTAPHGREWLALVEEWRTHPDSWVSFVADPRRTDLSMFDASARELRAVYRWPFIEPPFVGGARPGNADWYVLRPPGWMLDRGWALTAEVAGIAARDGFGPHRKPAVAWVRRRADEQLMIVGGRHLGSLADPAVRIRLVLGGRPLDSFEVKPGFFFRLVALSAGVLAGADAYTPIAATSEAADDSRREIPVALEQFDLQPAGVPMVGVEDGWQEPEYDPRTARSWRWTSERAALWVRPIGRDVTLTLIGESPMRYYDSAPAVTVTVGGRQIARLSPSSDFTETITLPAGALAAAAGRVVVESDRWFVPADRDRSPDRRHLALKIYSFSVK